MSTFYRMSTTFFLLVLLLAQRNHAVGTSQDDVIQSNETAARDSSDRDGSQSNRYSFFGENFTSQMTTSLLHLLSTKIVELDSNMTTLESHANNRSSVPELTMMTTTEGNIATRPKYVSTINKLTTKVTKICNEITNRCVGLIALVTNGLSLIIFVRMHRARQQNLSAFIAISVVDTLSLIRQYELGLAYILSQYKIYWTLTRYEAPCKLLRWMPVYSQVCSSYFVLLFTLERFISVRFPLKRVVICTRRRITIAIFSILIFAGFLTSYELYFRELYRRGSISICYIPGKTKKTYTTVQLSLHYAIGMFVPYISIAVFNVLIIVQVLKHRRKRAGLSADTGAKSDDSAQRSMTIMLVTVSSYSFITTFPRMVAIAWKEIGTVISSDINYFFVWSVNIIAPWNYCGNFFFYVLSGRQFRKELVMLFCCRKRSTVTSAMTRYMELSSSIVSSHSMASALKMKPINMAIKETQNMDAYSVSSNSKIKPINNTEDHRGDQQETDGS